MSMTTIALEPGRGGNARRMVFAAAATAGLLAASAPALAKPDRPGGGISGIIDAGRNRVWVMVTGTDGRTYSMRTWWDGRYRFRHLPAGTYTISHDYCDEPRPIETVVVRDRMIRVPNIRGDDYCMVIVN